MIELAIVNWYTTALKIVKKYVITLTHFPHNLFGYSKCYFAPLMIFLWYHLVNAFVREIESWIYNHQNSDDSKDSWAELPYDNNLR